MSLNILDIMLQDDTDGLIRDALLAQFARWLGICSTALQEPVDAVEYQRRKQRCDALIAAQRVLRVVWRRRHR